MQHAPQPVTRWLRRLGLERPAEHWLAALDPAHSLTELRARVMAVVDETADTRTLSLRPNALWPGHRAGQFTTVAVEIDGVRHHRCYSISSPPSAAWPTITVKRVPGGLVSNWLHERVGPGDVLGLGAPAGAFVLPAPVPHRILMYTGGSGITPVMSILRSLSARGALNDVVLIHHAHDRDDVIFGATLRALAARHRGLRVELRLGDELPAERRFDPAWLARQVPDFAERLALVCGPPGLTARVEALWSDAGAADRLLVERFVAPPPTARAAGAAAAVEIHLSRAGRAVPVATGRALLPELEQAGERPPYGCRMGICNTCACRKRSGTVRDLRTGAISHQPNESIRLCVTAAESDLELEL